MVQENFWIRGQRSPNGTRMQERSPSGARAEPERSRGLRKEHGTPKGRSEAGAEPERSPSGARTEHRTPKGARDSERTLGVPKLHYSETAESPIIPGRLNAPQSHQTPTCRVQNPDKPRAGRVGAHGGVAGRTGCQQNCSPRGQASPVPPKASETRRLNVSPEARTSEILCKPMEEQNPRLTRGSSAVYRRDERRSLFLAAYQWTDGFLFLQNLFMQGMSRN